MLRSRPIPARPVLKLIPRAAVPGIAFLDYQPPAQDFRRDILAGLSRPQKALPPKYFYDRRGSALFEQICELDEYYLTRVESALLAAHAREIGALLGSDCVLYEFGSGNSRKVGRLLEVLRGEPAYVAIDISRSHLIESASALAREYPHVRVTALCADFTQPLWLPGIDHARGRRVGFFPGSSIGNFGPCARMRLLRTMARMLKEGGVLLIGVDLKKDRRLLHAAYDDRKGVTAAFNLNLLVRINRELGADFRLDRFRHYACYDETRGRIEMHLESEAAQTVTMSGTCFEFTEGERIHTENSYKYSVQEFQRLAVRCGFQPLRVWSDTEGLFSLHALAVVRTGG